MNGGPENQMYEPAQNANLPIGIDQEKLKTKQQYSKEYYLKNKKLIQQKQRTYYLNNKIHIALVNKQWQERNPEKCKLMRKKISAKRRANPIIAEQLRESIRKWREKNPEKIKEYSREYSQKNKALIRERTREYQRAYRLRNSDRINNNKKRSLKKRMKEDPAVKLKKRMSTAIYQCIRKGKGNRKIFEILPYSIETLMQHIESQFLPDMSWGNYGKWHIDHKKPRNAFSFQDYNDPGFKELWSLNNLQPLWAIDNYSKGAKWVEQ